MLRGEPARERRSPNLCEQDAHDADLIGAKAIMGGSWVFGDRRLSMDKRIKRGDLHGTSGEVLLSTPPGRSQSTRRSDEPG